MKVLIVHVPYQVRGGEDVAVESQRKALETLGHSVALWPADRDPPKLSLFKTVPSLAPFDWPEVERELDSENPDVVLLNNIYPLYGPRFLRALKKRRIPVLWAVHNHRLYCTNGLAMKDGKVCKICRNGSPWVNAARSSLYDCNDDRRRTVFYAAAIAQIRQLGLLDTCAGFVVPSPYIGDELEQMGISRNRIHWIVNPVVEEATDSDSNVPFEGPEFDVFFGSRLSPEKGIATFLRAVEALPEVKFVIAGDGVLKPMVASSAARLSNLKFLGLQSRGVVLKYINATKIAVLPSQCNEALPTSVLEAFVAGKRCVLPDMDSTRWLAEAPFPGVLTNTFSAESIADGIKKTLQMPPPSASEKGELRRFFGFDRYRIQMSSLMEKTLAKP